MSKLYVIKLNSTEVDQLSKVLDAQIRVSDQGSLDLIRKIRKNLTVNVSNTSPTSTTANISTESLDFNSSADSDEHEIQFQPSELDKLINILYLQNSIDDYEAINLIAKIHRQVHQVSILKQKDLLSNQNLDQSVANPQETYYQYRQKRLLAKAKTTKQKLSGDPSPLGSLDPQNPLMTIVQTLESIADTLNTIVTHLPAAPPQSLGFTANYRREIIYCEARHGSYWHLRNEWQQLIPIHGRGLTCIIQSLNTIKTAAGELKLHLHVQADKLYCLELPVKGLLTTTLLNALVHLTPQQLQLPITIEPVEHSYLQELTCNVYYQGTSVVKTTEIPQPLPTLIKYIQSKLQQASMDRL